MSDAYTPDAVEEALKKYVKWGQPETRMKLAYFVIEEIKKWWTAHSTIRTGVQLLMLLIRMLFYTCCR